MKPFERTKAGRRAQPSLRLAPEAPADPRWENVVRLAARLCATPIAAVVSLAEDGRYRLEAHVGLTGKLSWQDSFLSALESSSGALFIPDARQHALHRDNPLVCGAPAIRFFAGWALRDRRQRFMGAFFVASPEERAHCAADELSALELLAAIARDQLLEQLHEERLTQERDLASGLLNQVRSLVMVLDAHCGIDLLNHAAEQALGYTSSEVRGERPWKVFCSAEQAGAAEEWFQRALHGGLEQELEGVWLSRHGEHHLLAWTPQLFTSPQGRQFLVCTGIDQTERRQLEMQLRGAQRMEAIGRLAGGVAHDFNNLLTIITGYSDLLLEPDNEFDPQQFTASVREIKAAAERAANLTRQLLAFSRQQVLAPRVLNLNDQVAGAVSMLRRLIGEDVELSTALDAGLGQVKADPGQIEQVLMNLAVNARDAMPQGGRLMIETCNVEMDGSTLITVGPAIPGPTIPPGAYVLLAVSDTGHGMSRDVQNHIFEPFFTTKEKGQGTGLGLSTVYGIVKQSGGFILVYSEVNCGTTFKVYLPRIFSPREIVTPAPKVAAPRGQETVLLLEDEFHVRAVIRQILQRFGYSVLEAPQPEHALEVCRKNPNIALLVSDVIMPRVNGREMARRMRELQPHLRVLFISGYTDRAVVENGLLEAGTSFLQKPFSPEALARKVREILDAAPQPSALTPAPPERP